MQQGSDEWLAWRRDGLGSSDSPVVMEVDPYRTAEDLLLDKTGHGEPVKVNDAMRLGTKWEPAARAWFFFERGIDALPSELVHPEISFLRASLDGECKVTGLFLEIKFMGEKNFNKVCETQIPLEHHWVQIQHQYLVSGYSLCIYVPYTLDPDRKKIDQIAFIDVKADQGYIRNELYPAEQEFWNKVGAAKQTNRGV